LASRKKTTTTTPAKPRAPRKAKAKPLEVDPVAMIDRYRREPLAYCREILGVDPWCKQAEILESVRDHSKTAVQSGNGVGKTFVAACALLWFLQRHQPSKVISTATTGNQVKYRLWREVRRLHRNARVSLGGEMFQTELRMDNEGWEAVGVSTNNPDNFQGGHEESILILFDEAQGIDGEIWEGAEAMMTSQNARWLAIANPTYTTGDFYEVCRRRDEWHVISISCLDHPNVMAEMRGQKPPIPAAVTLRWIEERRRKWGERSPLWESRVLGQFPTVGENSIIPLALLEKNAERKIEGIVEKHMGVDIARYGSDMSVAVLLENRTLTEMEEWSGASTMESVGRIRYLAKKWGVNPEHIHIDAIGLGAGVVDRLTEEGWYVDGVSVGETAAGDWEDLIGDDIRFRDRRAELYWVCRALLEQKQLCIPRRWADVWTELLTPTYDFHSKGHVMVEAKDKIRARTGGSPDHADALVLALSRASSAAIPWVMVG
jgi:phage terminase large subunit